MSKFRIFDRTNVKLFNYNNRARLSVRHDRKGIVFSNFRLQPLTIFSFEVTSTLGLGLDNMRVGLYDNNPALLTGNVVRTSVFNQGQYQRMTVVELNDTILCNGRRRYA